MRAIFVLAVKDLRLLLADPVGLFFVIIFPVASSSLFGLLYSGQSEDDAAPLSVVVVDSDNTPASSRLIADLGPKGGLAITPARDLTSAANAVRAGEAVASIRIPQGFGAALAQPFWGGPARIELTVDPSRPAEKGMLRGVLMQQLFESLQSELMDTTAMRARLRALSASMGPTAGATPAAAVRPFLEDLDRVLEHIPSLRTHAGGSGSPFAPGWSPIAIEAVELAGGNDPATPRPNAFAVSFPQGSSWGVLACAAAFAVSLVVERRRGTLTRLRLAPITRGQVLAGKGLACFTAILTVCTLLALFGAVVFGVRPQSPFLLALAYIAIATCFVGIMMLLSVLGRTEAAANGIAWSVLLICAMFGGGMMPLFLLPEWAQRLGSFSPVKWSITAMEGATWRNFDASAMLPIYAVLVAIGAITFVAGAIIDRHLPSTA
ncbi:MAG: ABC transporter permease [Planctomycetota bacterium]